MKPNRYTAELALKKASECNPGAWTEHSRYVAAACESIASHCQELSPEKAYILGLLHDIGRYAGATSERHLIDGYRYCMERGWELHFRKTLCGCHRPLWIPSFHHRPLEKDS